MGYCRDVFRPFDDLLTDKIPLRNTVPFFVRDWIADCSKRNFLTQKSNFKEQINLFVDKRCPYADTKMHPKVVGQP